MLDFLYFQLFFAPPLGSIGNIIIPEKISIVNSKVIPKGKRRLIEDIIGEVFLITVGISLAPLI